MEQKLSLEALTLADIQPSQFYISGEKPRRVLTWFDPADLRNFEPCPVHEFQGKAVFTDGHTRAFAAYRAEALSLQRRRVVSAETVYRSDGADLYSSGPVFPGIHDRKNEAGVCLMKPVQTRRSGDVRHFFRERRILDAGNSAMKTRE